MDQVFNPLVSALSSVLPNVILPFFGLGLIMTSFRMFDGLVPRSLPQSERANRFKPLLTHPMSLFTLGAMATFVTLSMSISVGMLIPLAARKVIRREQLIPYIMGAGITTFIDTFLASALMQNPSTIAVVVVLMLTITAVSLALILLFRCPYERFILCTTDYLLDHTSAMGLYMGIVLLIPLLLLIP